MKILDEFSESLKKNLLQVDTMQAKIDDNCEYVKKFTEDKIFKNAWDNYVNVY